MKLINEEKKIYFVKLEMFYLNTIEQLFLLVEQLDQLEVCLPFSRLLAGIPILSEFKNLRWNSNKMSLYCKTLNIQYSLKTLRPSYLLVSS